MRQLFLILFGATSLLRADTTPNLIWTGDPVSLGGLSGGIGGFAASSTLTGFEVGTNCFDGGEPGCNESFDVLRNFTVTSPGAFVLSTNIAINGQAFNCFPNRCSPIAFLSLRD